MQFKSSRIWNEWQGMLHGVTPNTIVPVVLWFESCCRLCGIDPVMTCVIRTREEQLALCAQLGWPRSRRSVHEFGRGVDIRSRDLGRSDLLEIIGEVNYLFVYGGRYKVAALHVQGTAEHIHLQVPDGRAWAIVRS